MMEKNKKDTTKTGIPDNAAKVWEGGQWAVFWSRPEESFYFMSLGSPSSFLRFSRDELLMLAQEPETQNSAGNEEADSLMSVAEGVKSTGLRNKRQFKRFIKRCETEFTCRGITKKGIASDFSINGLFIRTSRPFDSDEVIDIIVHLPDNSVSSLQGKVMRAINNPLGNIRGSLIKTYRNGMGVEITNKDANYLHFIRSLVKERTG